MALLTPFENPNSLALLEATIETRRPDGYTQTPDGVIVDWDALLQSLLSTTEKAAVRIAEAISRIEDHGGWFPPRIQAALTVAVTDPNRTNAWALLRSDDGADWQQEVANGDTTLGLTDWIANRTDPDTDK